MNMSGSMHLQGDGGGGEGAPEDEEQHREGGLVAASLRRAAGSQAVRRSVFIEGGDGAAGITADRQYAPKLKGSFRVKVANLTRC